MQLLNILEIIHLGALMQIEDQALMLILDMYANKDEKKIE